MKKLLLLPIALFAFSAHAATYNSDNYGYNYSGADNYDVAAQNVELKEQLEAKDNQLQQSFRTNESLAAELAQTTEWLNNCNYGNFVALQKLDTVTAEKEALETANEELQDDLADILALASHYSIDNPSGMAEILESIRTIAGE